MTENEAKRFLEIEKECINRNCDRNCAQCDIVQKIEDLNSAYDAAIKALEEVQQYRALGTAEDLKTMKEHGAFTGTELAQLAADLTLLGKYIAIGTPEECRAAMEKQTETLTVDKAKTIAAKAICIGCGYLADCKCDYNGGNCMVSKPMLESVLKSFDDWNRRANDGTTD